MASFSDFGISRKTIDLAMVAGKNIKDKLAEIGEIVQFNQLKVLKSFHDNRISDLHFESTTGYGYDDAGRDAIDAIYAQVFGCEDALVRHNFVNGTHAISTALFGILRPGDTLLSIGKPYDTLEEVIGSRGESGNGSLADFGISYREADMDDEFDARMVMIQRSMGYGWRESFDCRCIGEMIREIRKKNPNKVIFVDNCYGEMVEREEPTQVGADLVAGSLIKNLGGGLARTGGYIAGRRDLIEKCANRLNCVGLGKHVGATLCMNREILQGLFMAPKVVGEALKTAVFCAEIFSLADMGFEVMPRSQDKRTDIIQAVKLGSAERILAFCRGIQAGAPIDSFVTPEGWEMPGYENEVVMAAGTFIQGASIELSSDSPIKSPFIAYMQGGLTYESAKVGVMKALDEVLKIT
jgi:cystathionine beta-lyase family protein involved in aluminum resistance